MKKKLFLLLGFISVILGTLGIFLPLLPTTPFLLLAALCFERSSDKFYNMLIENRYFGKYLKDYREKKGITMKNKIAALAILTLGMGKGFMSMSSQFGRAGLAITFIAVAFHIAKLNTLKD